MALFMSLEFASLKHLDESKAWLEKYLKARESSRMLHPLFLLAAYRAEKNHSCLREYAAKFPKNSLNWLEKNEKSQLANRDAVAALDKNSALIAKWEDLQITDSCSSEAMDKLMRLIGLARLKEKAISIFKSALAFGKMNAKARAKNSISFNMAFLGNPGTGKTTVARLFSEILFDAGIRQNKNFKETTAQELKDGGADEFRKLISSAKGGVLFIDEAYDLDPAADFKGKPIVSELLTASENLRNELTIIIAGYEDEIHNKLFAFNSGMKSRFKEMFFDDFDEYELSLVWNEIAADRGWTFDSRISPYISKKLVEGKKKGFGNAREVRKIFEGAAEKVFANPEFNGELFLSLEDIAGEAPKHNQKLERLVAEIDSKIGWTQIKSTVHELIGLAQKNYERSLCGEPKLSFLMNRLFLG